MQIIPILSFYFNNMLRGIFCIFIFAILCTQVNAQQVVPFKLNGANNILVTGVLNEKDTLALMFQIAMNEASLSPDRGTKAQDLIFDHSVFPEGVSVNNRIQIGEIHLDSMIVFNNEHTGPTAEGKIGLDLFQGQVFEIDYDQQLLKTHLELPDTSTYQAIPLNVRNGQLFLTLDLQINHINMQDQFLLQSGYAGGLLFSNRFADEHQMDKNIEVYAEKKLMNSAGQTMITKQGILSEFHLNDISMVNMSAGVFIGEIKMQRVGYFGADLLRRFNWIFSQDRRTAYIKKSKYFDAPAYRI